MKIYICDICGSEVKEKDLTRPVINAVALIAKCEHICLECERTLNTIDISELIKRAITGGIKDAPYCEVYGYLPSELVESDGEPKVKQEADTE